MHTELDFQSDSIINVFVVDKKTSTKYYGEIRLHNNKPSVLNFKYGQHEFLSLLNFLNSSKVIQCESDFKSYSIVDFVLHHTDVYIKSIILGKFLNKITGIHVSLTGITDWATSIKDKDFKFEDDFLIKSFSESNIEENFVHKQKKFIFSIGNVFQVSRTSENISELFEYKVLKVKSENRNMGLDEAIQIAVDFRRLFSLLLAVPINFIRIWVIDGGVSKQIKFKSINFNVSNIDYFHSALVSYNFLDAQNFWGKILDGYFNSNFKRFDVLWSRIFYYLNSNNPWQYEILNLVSVLDSYCSQMSEDMKQSLSTKDYNLLIEKLKKTIQLERTSTFKHLADKDKIFEALIKGASSIKNTTLPTLSEKFYAVFNSLNSEIQDIFNFTEEEFRLLKKIRDATAHALQYKPKNKDEISFEESVSRKLLVIELFFILRDLNFTDKEVVRCFEAPFSPNIRSADLNSLAINNITKTFSSFRLNKSDYLKIKTEYQYNPYVLCLKKVKKSYRVLEDETSKGEEFFTGKAKDFFDIVSYFKHIFPNEDFDYHTHAFVYNTKNDYSQFHGVIVFK